MSKTKVHKVTLMIVDTDNVGDELTDLIENARYPNDCISAQVVEIDTREVVWADEHPLNVAHTWRAAFATLFSTPRPIRAFSSKFWQVAKRIATEHGFTIEPGDHKDHYRLQGPGSPHTAERKKACLAAMRAAGLPPKVIT
jgi:hypothetical protein